MNNSLLNRWKSGETTIAFHRGGDSLSDLNKIIEGISRVKESRELSFAVECDLKWTKDNGNIKPYIQHEGGIKEIRELSYKNGIELARAESRGEALSLEEVLHNDMDLLYNFDLKTGIGDVYIAIERILSITEDYNKKERVWFMAFNLDYLRKVKEVNHEIPTMFTSFLSQGYRKFLHQPSFKSPLKWQFVHLNELENVDIITTWPRGKLTRKDFGINPFSAIMLTQKVYDFVIPGISFDENKRIIDETRTLAQYNKLSFPGDFTSPYGVKEYLRLKRENQLAIAGIYVNIPEDISGFLKECGLHEREIKNI